MSKTITSLAKSAARNKSSNPKPRAPINTRSQGTPASKSRTKVPSATVAPAKSKCDQVLQLLHRNKGASLAELQEATGWQAHSVRGFLSGIVKKRMGLHLSSDKPDHGERRYTIEEA